MSTFFFSQSKNFFRRKFVWIFIEISKWTFFHCHFSFSIRFFIDFLLIFSSFWQKYQSNSSLLSKNWRKKCVCVIFFTSFWEKLTKYLPILIVLYGCVDTKPTICKRIITKSSENFIFEAIFTFLFVFKKKILSKCKWNRLNPCNVSNWLTVITKNETIFREFLFQQRKFSVYWKVFRIFRITLRRTHKENAENNFHNQLCVWLVCYCFCIQTNVMRKRLWSKRKDERNLHIIKPLVFSHFSIYSKWNIFHINTFLQMGFFFHSNYCSIFSRKKYWTLLGEHLNSVKFFTFICLDWFFGICWLHWTSCFWWYWWLWWFWWLAWTGTWSLFKSFSNWFCCLTQINDEF